MVRQICYLSTARSQMNDAELQKILDSAIRNNGPKGVTGLLAYGGGVFFSVLEGESSAIDDCLARLRSDARHQSVRVLRDVEVETREFAGWPMIFRSLEADAARFAAEAAQATNQPMAAIIASLGNPKAAENLTHYRLAA